MGIGTALAEPAQGGIPVMSSTRHPRFVRSLALATLAALAGLVTPNASHAEVAVIETTVLLQDSSEAGINAAVLAALDSAVREAAARGFQWVRPLAAFLSADRVGIQVLVATEPLNDADEAPHPGVQLPTGEKYEL
jgi:hypothetical protein